jgi:hypothetical protein
MITMRKSGLLALATSIVLLAACQPSASPSATASTSPSEAAVPSETPALESSEPTPVACTLPASGEATTDRAQIIDVVVDETADVETITFTFDEGTPTYTVDWATPPFVADPSDLELTVNGSSILRIVMHGATRVDPNGSPTYTGDTEFEPEQMVIQHLIEGGDFEAVATWFVGLNSETCPSVTATANQLVLEFSR